MYRGTLELPAFSGPSAACPLHSQCCCSSCCRNVDLREYLSEEVQAVHKNTTYDLIANIVHDGKPTEGSYRIHVLHHVRDRRGGVQCLLDTVGAGVACTAPLVPASPVACSVPLGCDCSSLWGI